MRLIDSILKKYDFVFRFLYSRCPLVRDVLHGFQKCRYHIDENYSLGVFRSISAILQAHHIDFKGKTLLELGPGDNRGVGYSFLANGAAHYIFCDKFPRKNKAEEKTRKYFEGYFKTTVAPHSYHDIRNGAELLKDIPDHSIDIIISVSVFEHMEKAKEAFEEMGRVLKPGGMAYASIDLRDHYNFNYPLLFLKYSDKTYNRLLSCPGYSYTNRLRADDYQKILDSTPFRQRMVKKHTMEIPVDRGQIEHRFLEKGDAVLRVARMELLLEKPINAN